MHDNKKSCKTIVKSAVLKNKFLVSVAPKNVANNRFSNTPIPNIIPNAFVLFFILFNIYPSITQTRYD